MIQYKNGNELAESMNVASETLKTTFDQYNDIAKTGKCPFGKTYFKNTPFKMDDVFYVAIVCPVLHFTMVYFFLIISF